jgi:hypothetical protein
MAAGCGTNSNVETTTGQPSAEAAKYLMATEPAEPKSVIETKKNAKDGDEVTIVGRIGGGGKSSPFVEGLASFNVVDASLKSCNERPGDTCDTPWDYCCETDLPAATVYVKVVDDKGAPVAMDSKKDLALKELQTVVVRGKAKRDEAGNLTILAPAVFVRK